MSVLSDCFVSVAAPLHDDADIVESFLKDLGAVLREHYAHYEIVLVDDGSTDRTTEVVSELIERTDSVRLITLSRSFGQEVAIAAALDAVIGDYVVIMLPDSDPPEMIPEMVETSRRGSPLVLGVRTHRPGEGFLARLGARLFYRYCNRVLHLNLPENSAVFRVMSRQAVSAVTQIKDRLRHIRIFGAYVGYSSEQVEYEPVSRRGRPRPRGLMDSVQTAVGIIVAASPHPLRLVTWMGVGVSLLNVLVMIYVVMTYLLSEQVAEGWVTRSLQTASMFFFLFLMVAVLCEYVGRILSEIQERPLYYVRDERSSPTLIVDGERKNVVTRSGAG